MTSTHRNKFSTGTVSFSGQPSSRICTQNLQHSHTYPVLQSPHATLDPVYTRSQFGVNQPEFRERLDKGSEPKQADALKLVLLT